MAELIRLTKISDTSIQPALFTGSLPFSAANTAPLALPSFMAT